MKISDIDEVNQIRRELNDAIRSKKHILGKGVTVHWGGQENRYSPQTVVCNAVLNEINGRIKRLRIKIEALGVRLDQ